MSATNQTQHGLVQYILDDEPMMDDINSDNLIIEQGLQKIDEHIADQNNPHGTDAEQLGLGNVDNTSDADKPVSTAQQAAINAMGALKIDKTAIVNDLTTGGADKVLSAEQGKILQASKADQPYQLHTQTDGGFHVEDSAGGLVADCTIGGNGWQSRQGKNLFPGVIKGKMISSTTGTISDISTSAICNPIPINISLSYRLSGIPVSLRNFVAAYDINHEYIGRTSSGIFAERSVRATDFTNIIEGKSIENAKYFRTSISTTTEVEGSNINAVDGALIQLELGLVTTPYEPYTPDPTPEAPIEPICLPDGTRFDFNDADGNTVSSIVTPCDLWATPDGTKDEWNPITGKVSHNLIDRTYDGSPDETWNSIGADYPGGAMLYVAGVPLATTITTQIYCWSNLLVSVPYKGMYDGPIVGISRQNNGLRIRPDIPIPEIPAWRNQLSITPLRAIYTAGNGAYTEHYSPQPITLPKGIVNVIVELPAGGGVLPSEMSLLYRQDLKAFIEGIINGVYDTLATHITSLTVRVAQLETAGGD